MSKASMEALLAEVREVLDDSETRASLTRIERALLGPEAYTASLPDGQRWHALPAAHREVWRCWQQFATLALGRGWGVSLRIAPGGEDGGEAPEAVVVTSVYGGDEECQASVTVWGEYGWSGQPGAPVAELPDVRDLPLPGHLI